MVVTPRAARGRADHGRGCHLVDVAQTMNDVEEVMAVERITLAATKGLKPHDERTIEWLVFSRRGSHRPRRCCGTL